MRTHAWVIALVMTAMLVAGCATTGPRLTASTGPVATTQADRWSGVWVERWPNTQQQDRYRINVGDDGAGISITPLTNSERQQLIDLVWDAQRLEFGNQIESRILFYSLEISADGTQLTGTVRSQQGEISSITWFKETPSHTTASPRIVATVRGQIDKTRPGAIAGNWQESWPGRNENDVYRVRVDGNTVSLEVLSNIANQAIGDMQWNGKLLAFDLFFKQEPLKYELFLVTDGHLIGMVTFPNGETRRIEWDRIGPTKASTRCSAKSWQGNWQEYWPGRNEHDTYKLTVPQKDRLEIAPLNASVQQVVERVRVAGRDLSFQLRFGEKTIVYQLKIDDSNTIFGTARTTDGKSWSVIWLRVD